MHGRSARRTLPLAFYRQAASLVRCRRIFRSCFLRQEYSPKPHKKRMCLGTFSRRGAVASATIYPCAECASSRSVFIVWKRSFLYDKKAPPILQNIVMNILQNQRGSFIFYKSSARCGALENSGLSCFIWNRLCKNHSQDALLPRFSLRQASTAVHRVCSD